MPSQPVSLAIENARAMRHEHIVGESYCCFEAAQPLIPSEAALRKLLPTALLGRLQQIAALQESCAVPELHHAAE